MTDSKIKKQLEEIGMAGNNEALLAFAIFQQAVKGNQKDNQFFQAEDGIRDTRPSTWPT